MQHVADMSHSVSSSQQGGGGGGGERQQISARIQVAQKYVCSRQQTRAGISVSAVFSRQQVIG